VGSGGSDHVTDCFWDMRTSGESAGGTALPLGQMRTAAPFLNADWDFVGETKNGSADIWWIDEGEDFPRLVWERCAVALAFSPSPGDGAYDVLQSPILSWCAWPKAAAHDVYFGEDKEAVANATPEAIGVYRGRQAFEVTHYDPGPLESGKTYYWRIDEVDDADPNCPWKGGVWSFATPDSIVLSVVDDFESYTDDVHGGHLIFKTWLRRGGGWVGNFFPEGPPYAEQAIVGGGNQSMPMEYWNDTDPWYSQAERTWETPQDWTIDGAHTLTLYFRGEAGNGRDPLYVAIEDSAGRIAVVAHPDTNAVLATQWQKWHILLAGLRAAGVDPAAVKQMAIGVGDRSNPKPGGTGKIYIDDIRLTKRMP
jgi:hypothetical protein